MDIVHNDKMKFVIMAYDEGTGLSEHAAPGEAIIFALDGEGVIGYEGKDHLIKAGMKFEGILRAAGKNYPGICDEVWHAAIRSDREADFKLY